MSRSPRNRGAFRWTNRQDRRDFRGWCPRGRSSLPWRSSLLWRTQWLDLWRLPAFIRRGVARRIFRRHRDDVGFTGLVNLPSQMRGQERGQSHRYLCGCFAPEPGNDRNFSPVCNYDGTYWQSLRNGLGEVSPPIYGYLLLQSRLSAQGSRRKQKRILIFLSWFLLLSCSLLFSD